MHDTWTHFSVRLPLSQDAELRVELLLYTSEGGCLKFFFPRTGRGIALRAECERRVNAAAVAAQREEDAAAHRAADVPPARSASEQLPAAPASKKARVELRVAKGAALRSVLREVASLKNDHKMTEAQEKLAGAATGKVAGKRTISNRATELADLLFKAGGLETTRAVLDNLLSRGDVKQLLPEAVAKRRAEAADAKTARAMLEAAKAFFNQLMGQRRWVEGKWEQSKVHQGMTWVPGHWVYGGRRTDADRNAFWASAAAMLPRDIFESRGGRAAIHILDVSYRVIKQAAKLRGRWRIAARAGSC